MELTNKFPLFSPSRINDIINFSFSFTFFIHKSYNKAFNFSSATSFVCNRSLRFTSVSILFYFKCFSIISFLFSFFQDNGGKN